jgi:hypothetical protein
MMPWHGNASSIYPGVGVYYKRFVGGVRKNHLAQKQLQDGQALAQFQYHFAGNWWDCAEDQPNNNFRISGV